MDDEAAEEPGKDRRVRRRRRANVEGGRRYRHEVRLTAEEEERLVALAERHRVSVPRLLVESALSARGETPTERRNAVEVLFGLHRLLAGISNNVNQVARVANSAGEVPPQAPAVLAAVRRTAEKIDDAVDGLSR